MTIDKTLAERGSRYGEFPDHSRITQNLKRAMQDSPKWQSLTDDQKEALEMIMNKIGRILNGDPNYADSWHDIAGYATLVEQALSQIDQPTSSPSLGVLDDRGFAGLGIFGGKFMSGSNTHSLSTERTAKEIPEKPCNCIFCRNAFPSKK